MRIIDRYEVMFLAVFVLITFFVIDGYRPSYSENPELSTVVFYVDWYDVGKAVLEGLEGIKRIDKGFRHFKETNTVYYDATIITVEEMKGTLKNAGTYLGTMEKINTGSEEL